MITPHTLLQTRQKLLKWGWNIASLIFNQTLPFHLFPSLKNLSGQRFVFEELINRRFKQNRREKQEVLCVNYEAVRKMAKDSRSKRPLLFFIEDLYAMKFYCIQNSMKKSHFIYMYKNRTELLVNICIYTIYSRK